MKKFMRLLSLTLSLLLICLAFCGCMDLDEERKHHAFWKDDERKIIILNDEEYKLLPECEYLDPFCETYYDYFVTKRDVPLLLKETEGEAVSLSKDKDFIILEPFKESENQVYCAQDRYEDVLNSINNDKNLEYFYYEYYDYDIGWEDLETKIRVLTEEESSAILTVLKHGETANSGYDYDVNYDYVLDILQCSEDLVFRSDVLELIISDTKAYLVFTKPEYGELTAFESNTYVVADELYDTFRQIADKYISSENYIE